MKHPPLSNGRKKLLFRLAILLSPFFALTFFTLLFGYTPLGSTPAAASGDSQYLSYLSSLHSFFFGDGFFDFAELATDATPLHARYAGSPFTYVNALFPVSVQETVGFLLFALKSGLAALSFASYLTRRRPTLSQSFTFMLSFAYALLSCIALTDGMALISEQLILLPLLLSALESFFENGKSTRLILTLTFVLLTGFAVAYATLFFAIIALALAFVEGRIKCTNSKEAAVKLSFATAISILFALPILLPSFMNLGAIGTVGTYSGSFFYRFPLLLLGFWPGVTNPEFPIFYIGLLPLLLFPLFFASNKFSGRYRACVGIVLAVFCAYFLFFNPFGGALGFGLSFFVLLLTADFLASDTTYKKLPFTITAVILLLVPTVLQKLAYCVPTDGGDTAILAPIFGVYVPLTLIAMASLVLPALLENKNAKRTICGLLIAIVLADGCAASFFRTGGKTFLETEKVTIADTAGIADLLFSRADETPSPIERTRLMIEGNAKIPYDRTYLLGSENERTLSPELSKLLSSLGANMNADADDQPFPLVDAFFGVSYVITDSSLSHSQYSLLKKYGDFSLYSALSLPTVFAASSDILTFDGKESSPFLYTNAFVGAMLGEQCTLYSLLSDVEITQSGDTVTLKGNAAASGTLCYHGLKVGSSNLNITVSSISHRPYENGRNNGITLFGNFDKGSSVTAVMNDSYPATESNFAVADRTALQNAISVLSAKTFENPTLKGNVLTGHITLDSASPVLMTTLPYDADYAVKIDGKTVKTTSVEGLLAIEASEGTHTVSIARPVSIGVAPSVIFIGLGGTLAGAILLFVQKTKEKKEKRK